MPIVDVLGSASAYYEDALARYEKREYLAAIIQLKNALQKEPGHLPARILIGRAYLGIGDGPSAEKELARARDAGADDELIIVAEAQALLVQLKFEQVLNRVRPGRNSSEIEAAIMVARGEAYLGLNKLEDAEISFAAASRVRGDHAGARLGLAKVHLQRGQIDRAATLTEEARELAPDNVSALFLMGEIRRIQLDFEAALRAYDRAIEVEPYHIDARISRAAVLTDLGRPADARPDVEFVREINPNHAHAAYLLSLILAALDDAEGADLALREADRLVRGRDAVLHRTHGPTILLDGAVAFTRGRLNEAYAALDDYVRVDPLHVGARKLLATIVIAQGRPAEAIDYLRPALEVTPDDPSLLALLGRALMGDRRYSEAADMLERAARFSDDPSIRTDLARLRLAAGRRDEAVASLEEGMSLGGGGADGLLLVMVHLREGEYDDALRVARVLIERDPDNPLLHNLVGGALVGARDRDGARASFEQALAIDPRFLPAHANLARLDLQDGAADAAARRYRMMLGVNPLEIEALLGLAGIAQRAGRLDEAISFLATVRQVEPQAIEPQLTLVELYLRTGKPDRAMIAARRLQDEQGDTLEILHALGQAQIAVEENEAAAETFARMAAIASISAPDLTRIAALQVAAGDTDGAMRSLNKALFAEPEYVPALKSQIELEARLGHLEAALAKLDEVKLIHPEIAIFVLVEGDLLMKAGRLAEAVAVYQTAFDLTPTTDLLLRLYVAQRDSGAGEAALRLLEEWLETHPDDLAARRVLAADYITAGRHEAAIAHHESLLKALPDDPLLLNNLGGLYYESGDSRALAYAERAHELAPNHPATLDTLGWILVMEGETDRGLKLLRDAEARASRNPGIRYHLAVALNNLGRKAEARHELETIVQATPATEIGKKARALLNSLPSAEE